MSRKNEINDPVEVRWDNEPLDVTLEKHGSKKPDRKVKVRGILREDWLEEEAGLDEGALSRVVDAIKKALRHGYEPRICEAIRFVHMVDADFTSMRVSVQPMGSFRHVLDGVEFTMRYDGQEMSAEDAEGLRDGTEESETEEDEVTPDSLVTCPKCHKRFRVGHKAGNA